MSSGYYRYFFYAMILPVFFLVFIPETIQAQRYHTQTFFEQDGLDSNTVYSAAQDSLGYMWFTTRNGLAVFDGINWLPIRSSEPAAPKGEGLVTIDANGVIWWVSWHLPLDISRLVDGKWEKLPPCHTCGNFSKIIALKTWTDSRGNTTVAVAAADGSLQLWQNESWLTPPFDVLLPSPHSLALDGSLLLISTTGGLFTVDLNAPHKPSPVNLKLPPGQVYGVTTDPDNGSMWVIGQQWIAHFNQRILEEVITLPLLLADKITSGFSVCPGPNGGFYFVDYNHIFHFHSQWGLEPIIPANGVITEGGNHVMMDRENNVWICSERGISKIISRRLACYSSDHGLLGDEVSSIIQRSSGEMVLGQRQGLTIMGPEPHTIPFGKGPLVFGRVNDLTEDAAGGLWLAANHRGVGLLDDDNSIQWFAEDEGLACPVYSVMAHPQHGLFAGTSKGLFRKTGDRFESLELPDTKKFDSINIRRLVPMSHGGFAIVTRNCGLFFWQNGIISPALGSNQSDAHNIYTFFEHHDGNFWIGTDKGLFRVEKNKMVRSTAPDPEIYRPVYSVLEDDRGRFWFGTDDGVTIWDGGKQTRITKQDGLLGSETNRAALVIDNKGHIWIGTDSGVSVYRKELDTPRTNAPILSLTQMMVNGKSYPINEPLQIAGPLTSLVFLFRAPSFAHEEALSFSAYSTIESDIEPQLLITHWPGVLPLTNVPPGQFQANITGYTTSGLSTNTITTPLITIIPPLQDRWYFRALTGVAGALLLWLVFAFFSGRRYAHRLENDVRRQTRDLRRSEENSRLESERLTSTLESISDGVVVVDDQSRVVLFNSAAEAIFNGPHVPQKGWPLEDILPVRALQNPEQAERYQQLLANPSNVRLFSEQVSIYSGDDRTCWLEISAVPIAGPPGGLVFAFRDVTSRRQTEQNDRRSQKLESLGMLAGGIAHDFNNLLTIMMGNLSLLEGTLKTTNVEKGQLDKIQNASQRGKKLTRQLLTFAKGGGPVREIADLGPIIQDSVAFNLSGSNVDCQIDIPENLSWAKVDEDQISQVIGNLVINARQAMIDGGVMSVSAKNAETWPGFPDYCKVVVIEVFDHGIGMSEIDQAQIFDPYFSTKETGTGLGLAIAHSVAEKHGGRLTVESALGQGSTFHLILPACANPQKLPKQKSPQKLTQPTPPLNILFMDDEEDIRQLTGEILAQLNHRSLGVANGESAREAFAVAWQEGNPFDLAILDLTIPGGLGGLETLGELRKINPLVKVIVASGYSDDPVMANFGEFGFSGILKKPFSKEELQQAIARLV